MLKKITSPFFLLLPLFLTLSLSYWLQITILKNPEAFTAWLSQFGPYIILVYILIQIATIIIAPLGGFFLVVTLIALFGPAIALTLSYLVITPVYLVNFYLARRFGRPLAEKLAGKHTLKTVDHLVSDAGISTVIILRMFQGGSFDYLSYGFGLSNIPFKTFAAVNFLAGIPATLISYFVISRFDSLTTSIIAYYLFSVFLTGISIGINIYLKKRRENN